MGVIQGHDAIPLANQARTSRGNVDRRSMDCRRAARARRRERDSAQAESGGTTADRRASVHADAHRRDLGYGPLDRPHTGFIPVSWRLHGGGRPRRAHVSWNRIGKGGAALQTC
jgi:hypothetical protein